MIGQDPTMRKVHDAAFLTLVKDAILLLVANRSLKERSRNRHVKVHFKRISYIFYIIILYSWELSTLCPSQMTWPQAIKTIYLSTQDHQAR